MVCDRHLFVCAHGSRGNQLRCVRVGALRHFSYNLSHLAILLAMAPPGLPCTMPARQEFVEAGIALFVFGRGSA